MYRKMRQNLKYAALGLAALALVACGSAEDRAKAYYESGSQYLEQKDFERAAVEFRNALKLKEDYPDAWFGMSKVEENNQNWPRVIGNLTKVLEIDKNHIQALQGLSKYMLLAGDFPTALRHANTAFELEPKNPDIVALKAAILMKSGDRNASVELAKQALALQPNHPDATILIAADLLETKNIPEAIAISDAAIKAHPDAIGLYLLRIRAAELSGDLKDQETTIRAIVNAFPEQKNMKDALAAFLVRQGRTDEAEAEYRQSATDPDNVDANKKLVAFLREARSVDAARSELEKLAQTAKEPFPYQLELAEIEYETGDKEAAFEVFRQLAKQRGISDQGIAARLSLAGKLLEQKQYTELESILNEVISNDARNVAALKMRGAMKIEKGNTDQALSDLREALNFDQADNTIRLLLANAYERKASFDLAQKELADAYRSDRGNGEVGLAYATYLLRRGSFDRAEEVLASAFSANPRDRQIIGMLADLRMRKGDWKGAEDLAKMAKDQAGDQEFAEKIMGAALAGQGRYDEAISYFQKAAEAAPKDIQPMFALVRAYIETGKTAEAEAFTTSLLQAGPENPNAHIVHGAVLLALNRTNEAKASYEKAVELAPDQARVYLALAEFYGTQKEPAKAIEVLNTGLTKAKDLYDVRMALGSLYERTNRHADAIAVYEQVVKDQPNATLAVNNLVSLLTDTTEDAAVLKRAAEMATVLRDSPVPHFRETLGWALVRQGNVKAGLPILEQTINELQNIAAAQYHIGMAYSADGSKSLAAKHLKLALELETEAQNRDRIKRALEILGSDN